MGKYALINGVASACTHFYKKYGEKLSHTTVRSIRDAYNEECRKRDREDCFPLPEKKRGRPVVLGDNVDTKVQLYLREVREGGWGHIG